MPRLRALILLVLFAVNQAACTSWQPPKVTPQEYAKLPSDATIRVTPKDPQGNLQGAVVLTGAHFVPDSVIGRDPGDLRLAFSLQQIAAIEVRRTDGVATGLMVFLIVAPIVLMKAAVSSTQMCCG